MAVLLEDAPLITVSVVTLSGKTLCELRLPANICTEDIYDLTSAAFGPTAKFGLSYKGQLFTRSQDRPFLDVSDSVVVHCTVGCYAQSIPIFEDIHGFGLTSLVSRGRHRFAMFALDSSTDPKELVDANENKELLSWVAYTAGGARTGSIATGQPEPGALGLLWRLVRLCPYKVRRRDPDTGKLPLHDAAWGHAPFEAAVMLAAAMPAALTDRRNRSRESPHDVGHYVHTWRFSWPDVRYIEAKAAKLRRVGQLLSNLAQLRRALRRTGSMQDRLQQGLRICPAAASAVASFLTDCKVACVAGLTLSTVLSICHSPEDAPLRSARVLRPLDCEETVRPETLGGPAKKIARPRQAAQRLHQRRRVRWPRGICLEKRPCNDGNEVQHLREHFVKDAGQYGGAHRVRNRRCGFVEVSEIVVGTHQFKLEMHVSHMVHQSVQRPPAEPFWPSKCAWQKCRLRERWEKNWHRDEFVT